LREALEAEAVEHVAQAQGDAAALADRGRGPGVEVERGDGGALHRARPRERGMELERGELGEPDQRGPVVAEAEVDVPGLPHADARGPDPGRRVGGAALLEEALRLHAVGEPDQRDRPALEVGEDHVGDARVVVDRGALGEPGRGPEHLVQVGELEAAAVYRDFAPLFARDRRAPVVVLRPLRAALARGFRAPARARSPLTAARLSSSTAMRSGALVGLGSSETASTTSSPRALRSISASSSSRYSSR